MSDQRTWRYRLGEDGDVVGQIFASPEDVPEGEGWQDSPAKCTEAPPEAPKKKRRQAKAEEPTTDTEVEAEADDNDA